MWADLRTGLPAKTKVSIFDLAGNRGPDAQHVAIQFTNCPLTRSLHTYRKSREARGLWAGSLHVARHTIGTWAVHVDGTGRVGRGEAPPRVGRCRCRRRVWRIGGTESLRRCCCCCLVVVHHCKGTGEVPLVGWGRCISSPRCGPRRRRHWLMRLPSCGRRGPFRDNETTSTQKEQSHNQTTSHDTETQECVWFVDCVLETSVLRGHPGARTMKI